MIPLTQHRLKLEKRNSFENSFEHQSRPSGNDFHKD